MSTIEIETKVYKLGDLWIASAYAIEVSDDRAMSQTLNDGAGVVMMPSWAEAMLWSFKLRADLEQHLMDQVYAERIARREQVKP